MPNLRLRVGADDLQVPGGHEEGVHLLRRGLVEQRGQEHPQVEVQGLGAPAVHAARAAAGWRQGRGREEAWGE